MIGEKLARLVSGVCVALATGVWPLVAAAEDPIPKPRPTHNLFGMTGLIDTPSADMQPDGQFTGTVGYFDGFLRTTLSAQFLPGLEVAFRYSVLEDVSANADLFDRSFDVKIRLMHETERWPALAVGLQDFLGTGVYSSEYLVATKGVATEGFGSFRLSGGLGWGRFATQNGVNNPLGFISDSFKSRDTDTGAGGNVNFGQFFRGEEMGFFGGVEWQTPLDELTVKVEYSPDRYDRERQSAGFEQEVPINVGVQYRPVDNVELGAYYMYGTHIGVRMSISGNPFRPLVDQDLVPGAQPLRTRQPVENERLSALGEIAELITGEAPVGYFSDPRLQTVMVHTRLGDVRWAEARLKDGGDSECPTELAAAIDAEYGVIDLVTFSRHNGTALCTLSLRPAGQHAIRMTARGHDSYPIDWYDRPEQRDQLVEMLADELRPEKIGLVGIEIAPRRVEVYIENRRFRATSRAIGRTARALTRIMPPSVEVLEITPVENSVPVATIVLKRSDLESQVDRPDAAARTWSTAELRDADPVSIATLTSGTETYPRFSWNISPTVPVSLFDPDEPLRADLGIRTSAGVEFLPGFSVNSTVDKRVIGQLDDINRPSDSKVKNRVRSDFATYLREGDPALTRLSIDYITKLTNSVYGKVTGGIWEQQYAGIGAEVLWKPTTQNWGVGMDLNFVRQRDFNQLFDMRDYETLTGHASVYWDTQFYGLTAQVDAGRYLAGDWGGTFGMKRRFPNGWEVGGFFTLTTIGFDEFGEGSFDKGIYLTIPLNWALPYESRSQFSTTLRPLTRDGGQRVRAPGLLYPLVEDHDRGDYRRVWEEFWE